MYSSRDPYADSFGRRHRPAWRDVMQVCLDGHIINRGYQKYPEENKEFCDYCGSKTITNCPSCNKSIPGDMQDTGGFSVGYVPPPAFCQHCGEKFPWQGKNQAFSSTTQQHLLTTLEQVFSRFHTVARQLRKRHDNRETLAVADEYDVQDLLHGLLLVFLNNIRPEEPTPNYAGKSARIDFLLKQERTALEVKMTRKGLGDREIGDQLLLDIARYKKHQDCSTLVFFIYDPEGKIDNSDGLISDLQEQSSDELNVLVFINPR